jgi:hypothetical protein
VDALPSEAKRLATSIYRAARRVREILTDLASGVSGNRPTIEICDLHEVIAAASAATANNCLEIVLEAPRNNRIAEAALSYAARVL